MKKVLTIMAAVVMVMGIAGCLQPGNLPRPAMAAQPAAKEYKDTIIVATFEDPTTMDPMENNRSGIGVVTRQIFEGLWYQQPDGTLVPQLATDWKFEDDTTIRFNLRHNVTFHNGDPFTANDVLFSFDRASKDPISASTFQAFDIPNCKVIDDYTFELKLKRPYAPIYNTLSIDRAQIADKAEVERVGDAAYARNPVGTGPYKFVKWAAGTDIYLTRYDGYWGDPALTPNIRFKVIPEAASRVIELETGGADMANMIQGSDVSRVNAIPGFHTEKGPSTRYVTVVFSMQNPVLADKNLRYALSCAIDKQALCDTVYGGAATVADGMLPPTVFGYYSMGAIEYDAAKAKDMLAQSGYKGETIDLLVDPVDEFTKIAEMIQNMWAAIGVKTNVVAMSVSAYQAQSGGHFQASVRAGTATEISNVLIIYDSKFGDRMEANDLKLDDMLAQGMTYYDNDRRFAFYKTIQEYLRDIRYTVPFAYTETIYGISDKMEGFVFDPNNECMLKTVQVAK